MIDRATVEKIKSTADIVEVVGDYVHLIRRGSNFMGLCPFHNERTPSFSVNKQRNFCYCFSCKKGGSPVNFIMEKEGLTYHEALLHLAKKYGIEVVERELSDEERERQSLREAMFVANEWAMQKMERDMQDTPEGRDVGLQYFTQRGVTDSAIRAFHLGYALDNGHELTDSAKKAGFRIEVLKALGLVGTSQSGRDYDRFRGRVIFPILNTSGKVIAFGGRDLKGGLAKYINSPESELYKKSNELYGIFQAKASIVKEDKCFLVEGYMDVIGMWQSGMKNVVASSGTALTDGQIAMIHRFTENITLIYDGDAAGIKASLRGIDMLLSHKLNVKVLLLPDGDDPDSFARKHTPEEFRKYVAEHETDIIRYKAQVMLRSVKEDPQNRISAINSVVESIAHIPDQVARDVYVQECSSILGIPEATIAKSVAKVRFALVEQMKKERTLKKLNSENGTTAQPVESQQPVSVSPQPQPQPQLKPRTEGPSARTAIYLLEKEVLKYCIRYAFVPFCSYEAINEESPDAPPQIVDLDVIQYLEEELFQSKMQFTVPLFTRIFDTIKELRADLIRQLPAFEAELDTKYNRLLKEGYDKIAESDMSVAKIEKAENELKNELAERRDKELHAFLKDFAVKELCSHEDDKVRMTAMELSFDKHHLSNIYLKEGSSESEEDKLTVLLVRAIDEWKDELINQKIKGVFNKLKELDGKGFDEEVKNLQNELVSLMSVRREMGKIIGDRTISNRKIQ